MSAASSLPSDAERRSKKARSQEAAPTQKAKQRQTSRLSYDSWVEGALALLAREGNEAVRIPRLCEEFGVTKGSFYWHFDDLDALRDAIGERWSITHAEQVTGQARDRSVPVARRISELASLLVERDWVVEVTVRDWAKNRPRIQAAVADLDRRILKAVYITLLELGFDSESAGVRAAALVQVGIGFLHSRGSFPSPTRRQISTLVAVLTTPAPRSADNG
ncbi:TetR/AcrR family transcriptional regulator [Nocardia takedensis]|uniref:TetR/AcrR family transcriptional regulator n=1 Tax=Nocardia takedensis TaxID=259390 RepID=UPI003F767009